MSNISFKCERQDDKHVNLFAIISPNSGMFFTIKMCINIKVKMMHNFENDDTIGVGLVKKFIKANYNAQRMWRNIVLAMFNVPDNRLNDKIKYFVSSIIESYKFYSGVDIECGGCGFTADDLMYNYVPCTNCKLRKKENSIISIESEIDTMIGGLFGI